MCTPRIPVPALVMLTVVPLGGIACEPEETAPLLPDVSEATFVSGVDHPYLPMPAGATWVYEAQTDEGLERVEVEVLAETRDVNGVEATQVRDTAFLDGAIVEDTVDWFAQDDDGNVWYLGEHTCEFEDGACANTAGSWQYGVAGALPGFALPANPTVDGQRYMQESFPGEAEDTGEVIGLGETAEVAAGTFTDCVRTHDTSLIDPALDEEKLYCAGVGVVLIEENAEGALVREELVETSLD